MRSSIAALLALVVLGGCETIGNPLEAVGGKAPAPDEFQVIARKPLVMPSGRSLPEPRPGAPSPLEPNPNRDAVVALLGSDALAVAPLGGSNAERVLLDSANAAAASPDVRVQLEADKVAVDDTKPYQPPTVAELFFGKSDAPDPANVLDPVSESQRLQRQGLATPNDPKAVPPGTEAAGPITIGGTQPAPQGRGPVRNSLPVPGTAPAF